MDRDVRTKFTVDANDAINALNRLSKRAKDVNVEFDALGNATVSFSSTMRVAKNQLDAQADLMKKNAQTNRDYAESLARIVAGNRKVASSSGKVTKVQKEQVTVLSKLEKALGRASVRTHSFTDTLNHLRVAAYALDKVFYVLAGGVNQAINYVENFNLAMVAFGQNTNEMMSFVNEFSNAFRLNSADVTRYAGLFYQVSHSLGLTSKQAMTLSKNWTKLTYDIASFYNIGIEEANTKLMAGLVGETEPLRRVGIVLTENNLALTAQNLGIEKSIRNMTEAEKIQLRYLTALDQTTNAQGDFARTFDQTANQLRVVREQINIFLRELGTTLMPMVEKWAGILSVFASAMAEVLHQYNVANGLAPDMDTVNTETSEYKTTLEEASDEADNLDENIQNIIGTTRKLVSNLGQVLRSVKAINNTTTLGIDELNILSTDTGSNNNTYEGWSLDKLLDDIQSVEDGLLDLALPDYDNVVGDNLEEYQAQVQSLVDRIVEFATDISEAIAPAVEAINTFRTALMGDTEGTDFFTLVNNFATVLSQVVAGIFDAFTAIYEIISGVVEAVTGSALPELVGIQRNEDGSVSITNDNIRTITKYLVEMLFGFKALQTIGDIVSPIITMSKDIDSIVGILGGWKVVGTGLAVAVVWWGIKKGVDAVRNFSEKSALEDYGKTGVIDTPSLYKVLGGLPSKEYYTTLELISEERERLRESGERHGSVTVGEGDEQQVYEVLNPDYLDESLAAYNEFYGDWITKRLDKAIDEGLKEWKDSTGFLERIFSGSPVNEIVTSDPLNVLSLEDFREKVFDNPEFQADWQVYNSVEPLDRETTADETADNYKWLETAINVAAKQFDMEDELYKSPEASPVNAETNPVVEIEQPEIEASDVVIEQETAEAQPIELPDAPIEPAEVTIEPPADEAQPIGTPDIDIEQPKIEITNDQPIIVENKIPSDESPVQVVQTDAISPSSIPAVADEKTKETKAELPVLSLGEGFDPNGFGDELDPVITSYEMVADETLTPIKTIEKTVSEISDNIYDATRDSKDDNTDLGDESSKDGSSGDESDGGTGGNTNKETPATSSVGSIIAGVIGGIASSLINGFSSMLESYVNSGLLYQDENGKYQSNIGNVKDEYTQNQIASDMLGAIGGFLPENVAEWYNAGLALAEALSNGLITSFVEDLPTILEWVVDFVKDTTQEITNIMPQLLKTLASPDIWTGLLEAVFETIISSIEVLPQIVTMAATIVMKLVEGIIEYLPKIVEAFADPKFWTDILKTLIDLALFIVENIGDIIDALLTGIPTLVTAIIDAIFSVNWFAVGWNIIVNIVQGIINGAISLVESVINTITATISKLWTWLGIPAIPAIHIPRVDFSGALMEYATGGFPEQGQLFIAREAGAEMVGSLGGRTAVANNDQIVEGIRAGVYDAVVEAMGRTNGNQGVTVYLDGKKIYQNQRRVAKRTGLGFGMEGV